MGENNQNTLSHEEEQLFDAAHQAAAAYSSYSRSRVEKVVKAVAAAAAEKAEFYGKLALSETGFGTASSQTEKNQVGLLTAQQSLAPFIDPQVDKEKKIVSFPKPAGVVVALIPSTNPVATVYYKVLITLMTRNAVILCPHPGAKECCVHAADFMAEVAVKAGVPQGLIQSVREPSVPLVNQLMQSDRTNLILATGGPAMVRAAYSSSNPAIGVGPGNVACYVHESADLVKTAERIVTSASFDNSLPCTTESVIIADRAIGDALGLEIAKHGAHHVGNPDEVHRLREFLFPEGHMNPKAIGKGAEWIAAQAGVNVPAGTRLLCIEIFTIGEDEPISKEKMFPLVGFIKIDGGIQGAIRTARAMLEMQGKGHSAIIHTKDPEVAARYGAALPVCRITVNASGHTGTAGVVTNLITGAVVGTGFFGRSSIDENVGPKHLIQWTRLAYNKDPDEVMGDIDGAIATLLKEAEQRETVTTPEPGGDNFNRDELRALIKELVAAELRQLLKSQMDGNKNHD